MNPSPPRSSAPSADAGTLELAGELKALAVEVLGRGIERMFDGADDMLFEMARRATSNKDQRLYFDTMRVVRLERPNIGRIFRDEIAAGFSPGHVADADATPAEVKFDELTLQESRSLEESIAISAMASKAEGLYKQVLFELARRIEWLIREKHAPIDPDALAPARISKAFRTSAESLDVEFDIELVIFKLFDRLVISDLGELYSRALRFLDDRGVQTAPFGARGPAVGGTASAAAGPSSAGSAGPGPGSALPVGIPAVANAYSFAVQPSVDAETLGHLRQLGTTPAGNGFLGGQAYYGDPQLGADLAAAAQGHAVPGWEAPRAFSYVQRAGAVGRMFNDILQDPSLPGPLKPRFDQLRFAVIKNALKDASFFADRQHPVRGLMNELATMAATARATGVETLRRLEDLVGQIQGQFEVTADSIRGEATLPAPVDDRVIEEFFAHQKDEAKARRQAIVDRTRKVVAEELQLRTLGRRVPESVWPLLNSAWAPLMALRLLKQGPDSPAWRDGISILERVLDSVDPRHPAAHTDEVRRALGADLEARLREIGMLDDRIALLVGGWRDALAEAEADAILSPRGAHAGSLLDEIPFGEALSPDLPGGTEDAVRAGAVSDDELGSFMVEPEVGASPPHGAAPDEVSLLNLLMVMSSWFRVYDHERRQSRWLKVVAHEPAEGSVTFAEFNGNNRLQLKTQTFLDDLVAGRAEPIDLGPAAKRALDAFLTVRRAEIGGG